MWEHPPVAISQLCTYASLSSPELRVWSERLRPVWDPAGIDPKAFVVHRKMWEWLIICHVLEERELLHPGSSGLGFGVGREPLVALFASLGCRIVATDLDPGRAREAGWTQTEQYAGTAAELNEHHLCDQRAFAELVSYRHLDMNHLPDDLPQFDFTWSSCALEHLGSLEAGAAFVRQQMRCVRPGGTAVHTTEFNVSSNDETVDSGGTVLYRRSDLEALFTELDRSGYRASWDFSLGDSPADQHVDVPPFTETHLRTRLGDFVTTSAALVVDKPIDWVPRRG